MTTLETWLQQANVQASNEQIAQMRDYLGLLNRWNKVYNLTAVREAAQQIPYHILDSLSVLTSLENAQSIFDIGTGAGLPGIPLAIMAPGRKWLLLDANGKKTRFVQQAVAELGLPGIEVVQARVEDYHPAHQPDLIISRAYASLLDFYTSVEHLCANHTRVVAMKSRLEADELAEATSRKLQVQHYSLKVPGVDGQRCLVHLGKQ